MAFATMCLARLFHGFNCRGEASVFRLPANYYSLGAFGLGVLLLASALLVPGLHGIFEISTEIQTAYLLRILVYALLPTALIQLYRIIRER